MTDNYADEAYRNALDEFEKFIQDDVDELPDDFTDYNMLDWQIFALQYLRANFDDAMEGFFESNYYNEDPDFPKGDWRYEVSNGETQLGYKEWLKQKREAKQEDENG